MKKQVFDRALAQDDDAQQQLIYTAYKSKDENEIDTALLHVATVRRMKSSGIFELLLAFPEDDSDDTSGIVVWER